WTLGLRHFHEPDRRSGEATGGAFKFFREGSTAGSVKTRLAPLPLRVRSFLLQNERSILQDEPFLLQDERRISQDQPLLLQKEPCHWRNALLVNNDATRLRLAVYPASPCRCRGLPKTCARRRGPPPPVAGGRGSPAIRRRRPDGNGRRFRR